MHRILLPLLLGAVAFGQEARQKHTEKIEGLIKLMREAQESGDEAKLVAAGFSVVPTRAELTQLLRPGPDTDAFLAKYSLYALDPKNNEEHKKVCRSLGAKLLAAGDRLNTRTRIHAATTEEIAAYERNATANREFPGGMQRFAEKVAARERVWTIVEFTPESSGVGMKYTCFTRLKDRWIFIWKPWRAIPRDGQASRRGK